MRSRSSRFFVVLLHLVGCPQHFHHTFEGIVGVQPWPMVMETLQLSSSSSKHRLQQQQTDEPVWLQDGGTGRCLGPTGRWTDDCGDATLWLPVTQPLRKRKRARMGLWAVEDEPIDHDELQLPDAGLVWYLVDRDVREILQATVGDPRHQPNKPWWKRILPQQQQQRQQHQQPPLECLTHDVATGTVAVQACNAHQHNIPREAALPSWAWSYRNERDATLRPIAKHNRDQPDDWCASASARDPTAVLLPCNTEPLQEDGPQHRAVQLSLIRYRAAPATESSLANLASSSKKHSAPKQAKPAAVSSQRQEQSIPLDKEQEETEENANVKPIMIPTLRVARDLAHKAALDDSMYPQLISPRLFSERHKQKQRKSTTTNSQSAIITSLHFTTPILLVHHAATKNQFGSSSSEQHKKTNSTQEAQEETKKKRQKRSLAHPQSLSSSSTTSSLAGSKSNHDPLRADASNTKPRARIPVHPYIAASQNGLWTDPQTGLQYPTDLSAYLGHDRDQRGRHTLMGVGQYRKASFIKVYGIALYVSKRDVLADPFFEPYAHLSAEELRDHPEFLEHMRLHPHNFERSIFIQTNMQLSAETIRGSLKADWTMLTEEAKELIMSSSMEPQPMNDYTLNTILKQPGNPSQCTCVTQAPPPADPSCCARGTELVFTWLKNGHVECRLNRRVVAVFPRPDIGQGIFYEYLRGDDPISPELRNHAVDGFPFVLAPLAQVKGVHAVPATAPSKKTETPQPQNHAMTMLRSVWNDLSQGMTAHASGMADAALRGMNEATYHAQQTARAVGDATRALGDTARSMSEEMGHEWNRKRDWFLAQRAAAENMPPHLFVMNKVKELIQNIQQQPPPQPMKLVEQPPMMIPHKLPWFLWWLFPKKQPQTIQPSGGIVLLAPDEIGPMRIQHNPTMNWTQKFFLSLVHFYLLLLVLASFPGSSHTRRLIRRSSKYQRRMSSMSVVADDSDCCCESSDLEEDEEYDADDYIYFEEDEEDDLEEKSAEENKQAAPTSSKRTFRIRATAKLNFSPQYVRGVKLALSRGNTNNSSSNCNNNHAPEERTHHREESPPPGAVLTPSTPLKQKSLSYFF